MVQPTVQAELGAINHGLWEQVSISKHTSVEHAPLAIIATDQWLLAAALSEVVKEWGYCPVIASHPGLILCYDVPAWELVILDSGLPALTTEVVDQLKDLYPQSKFGVLVGWWDAREEEFRQCADFILNTPLRSYQVEEIASLLQTSD